MKDSLVNKPERVWPNPYLQVGAIVGHTTATSSRLWFRTHRPGAYRIVIWRLDAIENDVLDSLMHSSVISLDDVKGAGVRSKRCGVGGFRGL